MPLATNRARPSPSIARTKASESRVYAAKNSRSSGGGKVSVQGFGGCDDPGLVSAIDSVMAPPRSLNIAAGYL